MDPSLVSKLWAFAATLFLGAMAALAFFASKEKKAETPNKAKMAGLIVGAVVTGLMGLTFAWKAWSASSLAAPPVEGAPTENQVPTKGEEASAEAGAAEQKVEAAKKAVLSGDPEAAAALAKEGAELAEGSLAAAKAAETAGAQAVEQTVPRAGTTNAAARAAVAAANANEAKARASRAAAEAAIQTAGNAKNAAAKASQNAVKAAEALKLATNRAAAAEAAASKVKKAAAAASLI